MSIIANSDTTSDGKAVGAERSDAPDDLRTRWRILGLLFVVYFFSSVDRSVMGIMVQPIKEDMLLADWQVGFLSGFAFNLVFLGFGLVVARAVDRGNRVSILALCAAFWSVMTSLCGLSANFVQLSLMRMGVGVGEAGCLPASHSLIADYFPPHQRTKALAVYGLGYPVGLLAGSIVAGILLDHWGWRVAFYLIGAPGLLVALATWRFIPQPVRGRFDPPPATGSGTADPGSYRATMRTMWQTPALRQMLIALTLTTFFQSPTATFLGPYLVRRFPLSYTQLGFIVGMSMMFGASISTLAGSWIAQWLARFNPSWLMWFPGITVAIGAIPYIIALSQSSWVALAVWMFFGALINATYLAPCYTILYNALPSSGRAKAAVIVSILMGLVGLSLGALLAGFASDFMAARLFGSHEGLSFLAACPGGEAAKGASQALRAACHGAVVDATQMVLIATMVLTIWPSLHYFLAGRHMRKVAQ